MSKKIIFSLIIPQLLILCMMIQPFSGARAQAEVVNVLFFYSPTCPHCHEVIEKDFPIFKKMFGEQLNIIEINTYEEAGSSLYFEAIKKYNIPENRQGVPTMIVGDSVLVGSYEIPNRLPGLVEEGLNKGGISVPDLPGLSEYIKNNQTIQGQQISVIDIYKRDLVGNSLSVVVLIGLLGSVVYNIHRYLVLSKQQKESEHNTSNIIKWLLPIIALIGLGVAIYMSFVEITNTEAICGPVGDCNTVQQSPYSRLFGIIPIGLIGVAGFVSIIIVWMLGQLSSFPYQKESKKILWIMILIGAVFATYLTFLEPFVIGATCAWCLTVSVCMIILLFLATPQAAFVAVPARASKPRRKHG